MIGLDGSTAVFRISGVLSAEGGLNPDMLLTEYYKKLCKAGISDIERVSIRLDRDALMD